MDSQEQLLGEVKFFRSSGFGFLRDLMDPQQAEHFFHVADVADDIEESELTEGFRVFFDLEPSRNRPGMMQATNIQRA